MIKEINRQFILSTNNSSYVFHVTKEGLLEHLHYGGIVDAEAAETDDSFAVMTEQVDHGKGNSVMYTKDSLAQPEDMLFEISSVGKGDYREPLIVLEYEDGSYTSDFIYKSHEILDEPVLLEELPSAIPDMESPCQQLRITVQEKNKPVEVDLYYTVYPSCDCITKRCLIRNTGGEIIKIKRALSLMLDRDQAGYKLTSFGGAWVREMHRNDIEVKHGTVVNSSNCGVSSNRSNPFVILSENDAGECHGEAIGFNLIYSGNHYEAACVNAYSKTRMVVGINPQGFEWKLEAGASFATPEAVMSYSEAGFRQLSKNMHSFVRRNIVRGIYKDKPRPILLNSWEAAYFNINEGKLLSLAKKAKEAGIELFVMDDGWFKGRNSDNSSLGDWFADTKKLPGGIAGIASKIHELGLDFGIWVEPEMINEDSDLFRSHPEYAMRIPGRETSLSRNQMNLDLTNPEVVDYVISAMREVFKTPGINYVKWDMNRPFSDVYSGILPADRQGETMHRYYLGLYRIMKTLTEEFPEILFEGCASGGNRFDLGMLCYFPQIWGSDDTDAMERTIIQTGYSYGYPMSVVTSHVSDCPNHQTLRNTPLDTRYNIACFANLGYELNLLELKAEEFQMVQEQVELYKAWRDVFFHGDFYRMAEDQWMVVSPDKQYGAAVIWQEHCVPNTFYKKLKCTGLDKNKSYHMYNIQLKHNIKDFGALINQVAPIHIKKNSLLHNIISKVKKMDGECEDYKVSGLTLNNAGIKLKQSFGGTGYNQETRAYQDYASRLYYFEAVE